MPNFPLAYHITFGTYGTRLHGDSRGTVHRSMNQFGEENIGRDGEWQREERALLKFPPRVLALQERVLVESLVPAVCDRGGWQLRAAASRADHTHVVLTADADGGAVRSLLKPLAGPIAGEALAVDRRSNFLGGMRQREVGVDRRLLWSRGSLRSDSTVDSGRVIRAGPSRPGVFRK